MKTLNESQKDILGIISTLTLFWLVMSYFIVTTPNYASSAKAPQIERKHVQSKGIGCLWRIVFKKL